MARRLALKVPEEQWLEVWHDNKCVGWLNSFDATHTSRQICLASQTLTGPLDERFLECSQRHHKIDRIELERNGNKAVIHAGIPPYAESTKTPMTGDIEFYWKILGVGLDDYEWIFDRDDFIPA